MYSEFLVNSGQYPVAGLVTGYLLLKNLKIKPNPTVPVKGTKAKGSIGEWLSNLLRIHVQRPDAIAE
jgi:hypothetical protein